MKKAITLYQPHALLTVLGHKKVETRPRKWNYTGPLVIHAGLYMGWHDLLLNEPFLSCIGTTRLLQGYLIGEVFMEKCIPVEEIRDTLGETELAFGNYSDGRFAYVLTSPEIYRLPIPCRGKQGVWNI